jgi:hypothetical protein
MSVIFDDKKLILRKCVSNCVARIEEAMECREIKSLFKQLQKQKPFPFPKKGESLNVSNKHGVYVIRDSAQIVVHVGRSISGVEGLYQRLKDHLNGNSSFARNYLDGKGSQLRNAYTFQYLEVQDERQRALLEHFATAWHCPKHLGLGSRKEKNEND